MVVYKVAKTIGKIFQTGTVEDNSTSLILKSIYVFIKIYFVVY
jgi:hypothetical protein